MTYRDNVLWQQCWRDRQARFHHTSVNSLLTKCWAGLKLGEGSRVFVPLCGMSPDMIWLAEQGHEVIGVELSPIAVRSFFHENHLLCGDFFALTKEDLGHIDAVYDRASLIALSEGIRGHYLAQLRLQVPDGCKILLLTVEDADDWESTEQAMVRDSPHESDVVWVIGMTWSIVAIDMTLRKARLYDGEQIASRDAQTMPCGTQ